MNDQAAATWGPVMEFTGEGLSVQVMKLPLPRPRYAVVIGSSYVDPQGNQKRGARIGMPVMGGQVKPLNVETLARLLAEAQAWVQTAVAAEGPAPSGGDEFRGRSKGGPRRHGSDENGRGRREHSGPVIGLKELRKRDKAAWEARQKQEAKPEESTA